MAGRRRRRSSRVPDLLGGRLFGGPRRTAREFVTIVCLVFGMVAILVLQTWQRVEMIETMRENEHLAQDVSRLRDLVVCRETALERKMSRGSIVSRAEAELGLRFPEWQEVVFMTARSSTDPACRVASEAWKARGGPSL